MKILFLTRAYSSSSGGMERLSYELISACEKDNDIEVEKIVHKGKRATSPLFVFWVLPKFLIKARRCDLVHLGDPMLSLAGWLASLLMNKYVVITVHGLDILYDNRLYRFYLKLFFRKFDLYLPISEAVKDKLDEFDLKRGKVTVINPGIANDYYDPSVRRNDLISLLRDKVHCEFIGDEVFLFTVGRLVKRKGHEWFVRNIMVNLADNVHYVIAGSGPEMESIKKAVDDTRLTSKVHLPGRLSEDEMRTLYNGADVFVQPNIKVEGDMEGFGLVLLEAALCNKVVLVSDIEGMKDAVVPGCSGELVLAEDVEAWVSACNKVVQGEIHMASARRCVLDNFSWEKYLGEFKREVRNIENSPLR